jgi:hypothetical protein
MVVVSFMVTLRVLPLLRPLALHLRLNPLLRPHLLQRIHLLQRLHQLHRTRPLQRVQVMEHSFRPMVNVVVRVGPVVLPVSLVSAALYRIHVSPVLLPRKIILNHFPVYSQCVPS